MLLTRGVGKCTLLLFSNLRGSFGGLVYYTSWLYDSKTAATNLPEKTG